MKHLKLNQPFTIGFACGRHLANYYKEKLKDYPTLSNLELLNTEPSYVDYKVEVSGSWQSLQELAEFLKTNN